MRKSWREKLADDRGFPKVWPIDSKKSKRWGEGTFVIPAPLEVDALMRAVPEGQLTTIDHMRGVLARRHRATIACPITTGIFAWIAAHAAAEGAKNTTPYWRTLKTSGELNPKYPGASWRSSGDWGLKGTRSCRRASATSWRTLSGSWRGRGKTRGKTAFISVKKSSRQGFRGCLI